MSEGLPDEGAAGDFVLDHDAEEAVAEGEMRDLMRRRAEEKRAAALTEATPPLEVVEAEQYDQDAILAEGNPPSEIDEEDHKE